MALSVFHLPDLGEGLTEADVVEWYVGEGEVVALDQPVVALESAKAVVDVPSPVAGRVRRHCARPGETVATGAPLVEFEAEEGDRAGVADVAADAVDAAGPEGRSALPGPERINAMPAARAKARVLGVELASITGTGPGGRIRVADVERAAGRIEGASAQAGRTAEQQAGSTAASDVAGETRPAGQTAGDAGNGAQPADRSARRPTGRETGERLRGVRKTMAERMALSRARVVPVTVDEDADIGDWPAGEDVTVRLIRALVSGCAASPALNAWLDEDAARRTLYDAVHLGIAADTGDGLFVPVLRDAGARGPAALRAEVDRLRAGAAARSLAPDELDGATITLSNYGMLAGRYGTPIVVPPQVAILGAGRAREEPAARGGAISIRRRIPLSLTFDHRACTGAEASRFLAAVVTDLERST